MGLLQGLNKGDSRSFEYSLFGFSENQQAFVGVPKIRIIVYKVQNAIPLFLETTIFI